MNFFDLVSKRQSDRGYLDKKVDRELIEKIIEGQGLLRLHVMLNLGTCMMGWFKEKLIKELLSIPKDREIKLIISLGYPSSDVTRRKVIKNVKDIINYNEY